MLCRMFWAVLAIARGVVNFQKSRALALAWRRRAMRDLGCPGSAAGRRLSVGCTGVESASRAATSGGTSAGGACGRARLRLMRRIQSQATTVAGI